MTDLMAHLEGRNKEEMCYREEYIEVYGYEKVMSVDLQKAIEKAVEFGSTIIEIKIEDRNSSQNRTPASTARKEE